MKKVICLIVLVFSLLLFVPNVVHAQSRDIFPDQILDYFPLTPRALEYKEHYFIQEHEQSYEYRVIYYLPYKITKNITFRDYILIYRFAYGFTKGSYIVQNSYILVQQVQTSEGTEFHFDVTLRKTLMNQEYPDGDVTPFFETDSVMYIEIDEQDAYQRGFNAGVKSITNKYTSYVFKWTLPFVTLVIISAIYVGYKKEWFHND